MPSPRISSKTLSFRATLAATWSNIKEVNMVRINPAATILLIMIMGLFFSLFPQNAPARTDQDEMTLEQGFLTVQGMVKNISDDPPAITVKPHKGDAVRIMLDGDTVLSGVSSLDDIERRRRVKIWYRVDGGRKTAVKVDVLPELGC